MKRSAFIIREDKRTSRAIAVDEEEAEEILSFLEKDERTRKKFRTICQVLLEGLRNTELYDKEEPDRYSKGVRAMKLFKGQENARIYCKELTLPNKRFVIIAAKLHASKKSQKLGKKERQLIRTVAAYEYDEKRIR